MPNATEAWLSISAEKIYKEDEFNFIESFLKTIHYPMNLNTHKIVETKCQTFPYVES